MFETKKMAARKTMEKKEHKLTEITTLLEEEITPTLEKLRKERSKYLEFQKTKVCACARVCLCVWRYAIGAGELCCTPCTSLPLKRSGECLASVLRQ